MTNIQFQLLNIRNLKKLSEEDIHSIPVVKRKQNSDNKDTKQKKVTSKKKKTPQSTKKVVKTKKRSKK